MSAFKRYQSKVFWDQMASRDLREERFVERNGPPRRDSFESPPHEADVEEREEEEDEDSTSKSENDTVGSGDITAIRVCKSPDADPKENACRIPSIRDESVARRRVDVEGTKEEQEREVASRNRSYSPLSQDLKSQDSGFSDSERSDCSEAYENATPRRKSRLRKIRERRIKSKVASPWSEEVSPPNPMHTSTPKDSRILQITRHHFGRRARSLSQGRRAIDETQGNVPETLSSVAGSLEGECLGDFLYASEPPEDTVQPATAKSPVSTDSAADDAITAGRDVLKSRNYRQSSSMRAWLTDLATETENECGNALQSKNLPRRRAQVVSGEAHARDLRMMSSAATAAASKLLADAEHFEQHYRGIVEKITRLEGGRSEMGLLRSIEEAAFALLSQLGSPPPRRIQQGSLRGILAQLQTMKTYVDGTVDTRLDFYTEKIVRGLEEAPCEDHNGVARGALAALTALGLSDTRAGSSIARCFGIRALLRCLTSVDPRDPSSSSGEDLVAVSLRALASVCSSTTAIEYFVRDDGPEILTDLLQAESTREKEKTEAAALVVQITAPWTNAIGLPYLEPFADSLIPALNRLLENTGCAQTLLLTAAALNNMSKSRLCSGVILQEDSVKKLLRGVKKSAAGGNVWLMEQVAALIGELARTPAGRAHLAKVRASVALVSFLRMRPPGLEDAYRRLEITAATALTRLCVDPEIARQVVTVGGGDFLPTCDFDRPAERGNDEVQVEAVGLLRYTRSLRRACRKAAKQIGIAKAKDRSTMD